MTKPGQPLILLIGNDPPLEYLLTRYANKGGCEIQSMRDLNPEIDIHALRPLSMWFSSLDVLEESQPLRAKAASLDIPVIVCSSVADDVRAIELGADYVFLHPITYDCFLSTLPRTNLPLGEG